MTAPPPRRPWWKRKRTWAAGVTLLVVAYPMSAGPVGDLGGRGWLDWLPRAAAPWPPVAVFYAPLVRAHRTPPGRAWDDYVTWCERLGRRRAASD